MAEKNNNYRELVFRLARTDFKLRYHGSFLGYVWAILKPLLLFTILNFVFSRIFNTRSGGVPFYSLQLLTGLLLFNFFAEGTTAGINSFLTKAQLVTKAYIPKWIIVISSTLNAFFVFCANLVVLTIFFAFYHKVPSLAGIGIFFLCSLFLYVLIVAIVLLFSPLLVRFRDISMIWEVLLTAIMYASPIVYPLSVLPSNIQKIILLNPVAFIIYHAKEALILNNFIWFQSIVLFVVFLVIFTSLCFWCFKKMEPSIAEHI
jgi:ABC-type polysaccharide/polyol phosphate export permease